MIHRMIDLPPFARIAMATLSKLSVSLPPSIDSTSIDRATALSAIRAKQATKLLISAGAARSSMSQAMNRQEVTLLQRSCGDVARPQRRFKKQRFRQLRWNIGERARLCKTSCVDEALHCPQRAGRTS